MFSTKGNNFHICINVSSVIALLTCTIFSGCTLPTSGGFELVKAPPGMHYQLSDTNNRYAINRNIDGDDTTPTNAIQASARPLQQGRLGRFALLSKADVIQELRENGLLILPTVNDHKYIIPLHSWVDKDYSRYFDSYIDFLGAQYQAEGMDCDNFADFYRQNLVLANLKAGGANEGDVPCATVVVNQRDTGIYHALNLMRTSRGWFVIEPQQGSITSLRSYRYLADITKVTL